jgi:hypothetical protein
MIRGVHAMFYSSKTDELRTFIRDKLQFAYMEMGDGWLIFDLPEAEIGCHPSDARKGAPTGTHSISFYCDDIEKTVAELLERGVVFDDAILEREYGWVTHFTMPGRVKAELYQPRYRKFRAVGKKTAKSAHGQGSRR